MSVAGAAKRYAQAAFDLAKDQGTLDQWEQQLARLGSVMQNPEVEEFFQHPAIPEEAKLKAINEMVPGEEHLYVRNLAMLLLERGRLHQLPQVVSVFHDLVLIERGIAIADVTTAVELTPAETKEIIERLQAMTGKEIQVKTRVDPSIIGGIIVRIGDTLIDGSVRAQLTALRQQLAR